MRSKRFNKKRLKMNLKKKSVMEKTHKKKRMLKQIPNK